jgi:hypothetical protein
MLRIRVSSVFVTLALSINGTDACRVRVALTRIMSSFPLTKLDRYRLGIHPHRRPGIGLNRFVCL